jgi:hypothetical protein
MILFEFSDLNNEYENEASVVWASSSGLRNSVRAKSVGVQRVQLYGSHPL